MANDDDIARLLPEPPPPRPTRREASIAEALRRFDGGEPPPPAAAPRPTRWRGIGRPQLGALISVALIALIGAPAAWMSLHDRFPDSGEPAATNAAETVTVADSVAPIASPSTPAPAAPAQPSAHASGRAASPAAPRAVVADKAVAARDTSDALAALPPPPAMKMAAPSPQPPPAAAASVAEARPEEARDIAVTGSRRHAPEENARAQRFSPSADDDIDGVIATFDAALARDPHNSRAWLDRGRARQRQGDLAGALNDLDHAIRLAPDAAAGYRARAQVERQRGDTRRAAADERRAAELDEDR